MDNNNLLKIMNLKPETLAKNQHDTLKEYAISVLQNVLSMIQDE